MKSRALPIPDVHPFHREDVVIKRKGRFSLREENYPFYMALAAQTPSIVHIGNCLMVEIPGERASSTIFRTRQLINVYGYVADCDRGDILEVLKDIEFSPVYKLMLSDDVDETFTNDCLYEILVEVYGGDYRYHREQKEKFDAKYEFVLQ